MLARGPITHQLDCKYQIYVCGLSAGGASAAQKTHYISQQVQERIITKTPVFKILTKSRMSACCRAHQRLEKRKKNMVYAQSLL